MATSPLSFRNLTSASVLAALTLLLAPELHAQEAKPADGAVQVKYRRAIQAFEQKQWEEARRLLLELWEAGPTYDVAISLVQVEYQLEQRAAAARYLAFALDHAPPTESVVNLDEYKTNLSELERLIGAARIGVTEPGAELYVDGKLVGRTPVRETLYLEVGKHTVEARLGTRIASRVIDVVAGSKHEFVLELRGTPEPAPPAPATSPPPGTAAVPPDDERGDANLWPALVGGTVAAAGIGMFIGFRVSASSDNDRIEALARQHGSSGCSDPATRPSGCDDQKDALESYDRKRDWSTAGAAIAATAVVGTVGYYLFWPAPGGSRETARAAQPNFGASLTSREAELWVRGSF
jgi:hypothetical protein